VDLVEAVAVEAVIEERADCADLDRARAALSEALVAASAPARGGSRPRGARSTSPSSLAHWSLTMNVVTLEVSRSARPAGKSVEAVIVDDAGTIVAQRTLTDRSARTCVPLARAVGAWASLVLDAEMLRAKDDDGSQPSLASSSAVTSGAASGSGFELASWRPVRDMTSPPDTVEPSARSPRAFEVGTMVYLRNGVMASGGVSGISPFVAFEFANAWVVRPSLAVGRSTQGTPTVINHVGGRADLCRRIPGNYIERRGVEADLCAGLEGGVVTTQTGPSARGANAARFGLGPSATLRGELGWGVALEARGLLGANLLLSPLLADDGQPPLLFAAAELGVSVRLP
jgi:hypothetical protein